MLIKARGDVLKTG